MNARRGRWTGWSGRLVADGLTVVLVSHDLNRVMNLVDTVLVLDHGRLVERGQPRRGQVSLMTSTSQIPSWIGVAASVLLVGVAVAVLPCERGSG